MVMYVCVCLLRFWGSSFLACFLFVLICSWLQCQFICIALFTFHTVYFLSCFCYLLVLLLFSSVFHRRQAPTETQQHSTTSTSTSASGERRTRPCGCIYKNLLNENLSFLLRRSFVLLRSLFASSTTSFHRRAVAVVVAHALV